MPVESLLLEKECEHLHTKIERGDNWDILVCDDCKKELEIYFDEPYDFGAY